MSVFATILTMCFAIVDHYALKMSVVATMLTMFFAIFEHYALKMSVFATILRMFYAIFDHYAIFQQRASRERRILANPDFHDFQKKVLSFWTNPYECDGFGMELYC